MTTLIDFIRHATEKGIIRDATLNEAASAVDTLRGMTCAMTKKSSIPMRNALHGAAYQLDLAIDLLASLLEMAAADVRNLTASGAATGASTNEVSKPPAGSGFGSAHLQSSAGQKGRTPAPTGAKRRKG